MKKHWFPSVILMAILPLLAVFGPTSWVGPTVFVSAILFLIETGFLRKAEKNPSLLKPYLIFFFLCFLLTLVSEDLMASSKRLERYISMLIIPSIVFGSRWGKDKFILFCRIFILFLASILFFSFIKLGWFVVEFSEWIERMREVNGNNTYVQFKYPHLMWDTHPTYWSYLLIIANIILLNNTYFGKVFSKRLVVILLVLFNFNLLYLTARMPILVNLIVHIITFIGPIKKNRKKLFTFIIACIVVLTIAFFALPFFRYKIVQAISDDRFFLWKLALDRISQNNFLFGEGFGLSSSYFDKVLTEINDPRVGYKGTEIHNQYLMALLESGLLGLVLLLYIIFAPLIKRLQGKIITSVPLTSLLILVLLACLIEPFLSILKGIIIFSVFSSFFLIYHLRFQNNEVK